MSAASADVFRDQPRGGFGAHGSARKGGSGQPVKGRERASPSKRKEQPTRIVATEEEEVTEDIENPDQWHSKSRGEVQARSMGKGKEKEIVGAGKSDVTPIEIDSDTEISRPKPKPAARIVKPAGVLKAMKKKDGSTPVSL
jgi:hypothetical protein